MPRKCFYCEGVIYTFAEKPDAKASERATRDHILPKQYFNAEIRQMLMDPCTYDMGRVQNFRWACAVCNTERGNLGHCPGALAAARSFPDGLRLARRRLPVVRLPPPPAPVSLGSSLVVVKRSKGVTVYRTS